MKHDCVVGTDSFDQALTIAGALMILGSMAWLEYRGRPSATRTRLVQALVVSDLILG